MAQTLCWHDIQNVKKDVGNDKPFKGGQGGWHRESSDLFAVPRSPFPLPSGIGNWAANG